MSFASKLSAGLLAAACVCQLTAAEVLTIKEPTDFMTPKRVRKTDDGISVKGAHFQLLSVKTLTPDPAKKYRLSGEFRLNAGEESGDIYLGFAPLDAEGKPISPVTVNPFAKTDTVVAKAAAAGDTVIYVKDASKWNMKAPHGHIVFNTKEDLSDLPNRDYAAVPKGSIKQSGDVWEITLKSPLKKDIAEGTSVRQHNSGAAYIYLVPGKKVSPEWQTFSGEISGAVATMGIYSKKLWRGTASVRILIMMLKGHKDNVIEFRNVKAEEVE